MVPLNDFPEKKSLSDLREIEKNLTTEKRIRLFWESVKILREKLNRKGNLEKLSRSTKALKEIFEIYSDKIEKTPIRENLDFLIEQKLFSILWNTKSWEPYALEKIKNDLNWYINLELEALEWDFWTIDNYRQFVEKNVKIVGFDRWVNIDEKYSDFYRYFTIEYINFTWWKIETDLKYLKIDEKWAKKILEKVSKKVNIWDLNLELNTSIWKIEINFSSNKKHFDTYSYANLLVWEDSKWWKRIFLWSSDYTALYNQTDKELTTSDYLDKNWLSIQSITIVKDLFFDNWLDFDKLTWDQKEIAYSNLINLIKYITYIETWSVSSFQNNDSWSTAKWPFQVLDWYKNWKRLGLYQGKATTFELRLRLFQEYTWWNPKQKTFWEFTPHWLQEILRNPGKHSPNALTHRQSIDLFLIWSFYWEKNKNRRNLLIKVLLNWDFSAAEKIYEKHHTAPDLATRNLMEKAKNIFAKYFKKVK